MSVDLEQRLRDLPHVADDDPGPTTVRNRATSRRRTRRVAIGALGAAAVIAAVVAVTAATRSTDDRPDPRVVATPGPDDPTTTDVGQTTDVEQLADDVTSVVSSVAGARPEVTSEVVAGPNLVRTDGDRIEVSTDLGRTWSSASFTPEADAPTTGGTRRLATGDGFVLLVASDDVSQPYSLTAGIWVSHDDGLTFTRSRLDADGWDIPQFGPYGPTDSPLVTDVGDSSVVFGPATDVHGEYVFGSGTPADSGADDEPFTARWETTDQGRSWQLTWVPGSVVQVWSLGDQHADQPGGRMVARTHAHEPYFEGERISFSDDAGITWSPSNTPMTVTVPRWMDVIDGHVYFLGGGDIDHPDLFGVHRSVDGESWQRLGLEVGGVEWGDLPEIPRMIAGDGDSLAASVHSVRDDLSTLVVKWSGDGGATWTDATGVGSCSPPEDWEQTAAATSGELTVLAVHCGTGSRLIRTLDHGRTWATVPGSETSSIYATPLAVGDVIVVDRFTRAWVGSYEVVEIALAG